MFGLKKLVNIVLIAMTCSFFTSSAYKIIPIGAHCSAAAALKNLNLRTTSLPFDWVVSPFESLFHAFNNDFAHFLEKSTLKIREDKQAVVDYYGLQFPHDFPVQSTRIVGQGNLVPNYMDFYNEIYAKYARRIERMYSYLRGNEKVYFVRHYAMEKHHAILFRNLIAKKFPQLDFTLIVVSGIGSDHHIPWREHRIENFFLDDRTIWNDLVGWEKIYKQLGLPAIHNKFIIAAAAIKCVVCNFDEYHKDN